LSEPTAIRHDETVGLDIPTDLYSGYESWKRWDRLFTYSAEEATYFAGEMTNIRIEGAELLEIGFGSGSFLAWARDQKANIAGTEIIPQLINAADRCGVELLPAEFERVASDYPGRFDTIVAFDVFEHFALQEIVVRLKACEAILKIGGHLVLRFPNAQSPFGLAPQNGDPTHKTALSRGIFEQLTQGTGLKVVRYAPSFRIRGVGLGKRLMRAIRYAGRDLIAVTFNALYSQEIPWDPVVVLVMRKTL
jgi:SAM-dependent methyltransferase